MSPVTVCFAFCFLSCGMVVMSSLTAKYLAHREAGIVSSHCLKTQATLCGADSQVLLTQHKWSGKPEQWPLFSSHRLAFSLGFLPLSLWYWTEGTCPRAQVILFS